YSDHRAPTSFPTRRSSDLDGEGATKDGKGGIAILNRDGIIKNQEWVTGMNASKGMAIHDGLLYVADITAVVAIDLNTGETVHQRSEEHTSELQSRENLVCR